MSKHKQFIIYKYGSAFGVHSQKASRDRAFAGGVRPWIRLAGHTGHEGVEHMASVNIYLNNRNTLLLWGRGTESEIIMEDQAEVVGNG